MENDRAFFENKRWYNIDDCVDRLKKELVSKYKATKDVRKAIKAYNGSGSADKTAMTPAGKTREHNLLENGWELHLLSGWQSGGWAAGANGGTRRSRQQQIEECPDKAGNLSAGCSRRAKLPHLQMERKSCPPALGLESTDPRDGILIHPCHDDAHHYLSSIGCINPASGLTTSESGVNLQDSLDRTLAIIGAIQKAYNTLPKEGTIPNAVVIIEGEPA